MLVYTSNLNRSIIAFRSKIIFYGSKVQGKMYCRHGLGLVRLVEEWKNVFYQYLLDLSLVCSWCRNAFCFKSKINTFGYINSSRFYYLQIIMVGNCWKHLKKSNSLIDLVAHSLCQGQEWKIYILDSIIKIIHSWVQK